MHPVENGRIVKALNRSTHVFSKKKMQKKKNTTLTLRGRKREDAVLWSVLYKA